MEQLNSIVSVLLMSFAISMDAFSVSLSLGMQNVRLKKMFILGCIVGIFHILLPFTGMIIGQVISTKVTFITELTGGFILVLIGSHMAFSALQENSRTLFPQEGWKLLLVALLVSIDSFPTGLSVGMFDINGFYVVLCFGGSAMVFSWIGVLLGKKIHVQIGRYSEMVGGFLLFVIGIYIIFA